MELKYGQFFLDLREIGRDRKEVTMIEGIFNGTEIVS